ncbi:MAG TPA: hypothetical protein QGF41_06730 [Gammaproteobacteria bacterium]|nr:hypothetical protein [Gammaproteobacteria bacterium]|tara:strand:+ start:11460 stop:12362 length:903 start_codon:yes stop_codon:yes gene_type:complete
MAATDETGGVSKSAVSYALPLVVAVTGHRELVADEVPQIRARVKSLFEELCEKYPYSSLTILSPLAEGADMLVAEVALELDLDLVVPLPKPKQDYLDDFKSKQGREHFEQLLSRATDVFELADNFPAKSDDIGQDEWEAAFPYAQLGAFLCAHCHILLAIWDGNESDKMGGTAQVVKFHHDDVMRGLTPKTGASQQMLVDDESDLVFHIPCSRDKEGFEPHPEIEPLDWCWYTKDEKSPRSKKLPAQHELIFQRSSEFSTDAIKFADSIETGKWSLLTDEEPTDLPLGIASVNHLYCIAD